MDTRPDLRNVGLLGSETILLLADNHVIISFLCRRFRTDRRQLGMVVTNDIGN